MRHISIDRRRLLALLAVHVACMGLYTGIRPGEAAQLAPPAQLIQVDEELVPSHREPPPPPLPPPPPPPSQVEMPPQTVDVAAGLRSHLQAVFSAAGSHHVGVAVAAEGLGKVVDINGSHARLPASTQKLYVAAAALLRLGPNTRLQTQIFTTGQLEPSGVLNGDLVVLAGGDPTLTQLNLKELAAQVHASGIRQVKGSLYVDDSRYDQIRVAPGWKPHFVPKYVGSLSAFAVDGNQWTPERRLVDDPAGANLGLFRIFLEASGVTVDGQDQRGWPRGARSLVASLESPTVAEITASMLKRSDNFLAEMLTKELGRGAGDPSTAGGVAVMRQVLEQLGIAVGELHDGSGLSYDNRSPAWQQVDLLSKMESTPVSDVFKQSLAVTCDAVGTLRNRLCGTAGAGRVFGKSGALDGVRALTGYTATASGRRVWFSFLLNGVVASDAARAAMDNALLAITTFSG